MQKKKSGYRERKKQKQQNQCHLCQGSFRFCWQCRCGFAICQTCMDENIWGMSCNHITWECPDCGGWNGLGNQ